MVHVLNWHGKEKKKMKGCKEQEVVGCPDDQRSECARRVGEGEGQQRTGSFGEPWRPTSLTGYDIKTKGYKVRQAWRDYIYRMKDKSDKKRVQLSMRRNLDVLGNLLLKKKKMRVGLTFVNSSQKVHSIRRATLRRLMKKLKLKPWLLQGLQDGDSSIAILWELAWPKYDMLKKMLGLYLLLAYLYMNVYQIFNKLF